MDHNNDTDISGLMPLLTKMNGLRPLGSAKRTDVTFVISVDQQGQPWLTAQSPLPPDDGISLADKRVVDDMRRSGSAGFTGFGNVWQPDKTELRVSLWESPYLVNLLRSCRKVTVADGRPLRFSDDAVTFILPLSHDKENDRYVPSLKVRCPDGERPCDALIGDTTLLADDTLYNIPSVGDNYANISALIVPVDAPQLESYLSLLLTFIDNIQPEIDGTPARYSPHPEHSIPTVVLEKVAADQALYLRVTSTVGSLGEAYSGPIELTRSVTLTDGGGMVVRDIVGSDITDDCQWLDDLLVKSCPNRQARKDIYRDNNFFIIPAETAGPFLLGHLPELLQRFKLLGSDKLKEYKVTPAMPKLNVRLSSGIDFLEGEADVTIGNERMTISDLLAQYTRNHYIQLSDGNRAIIDQRYINRLQRLFSRKEGKGRVKVSLFDLPEIEDLLQQRLSGEAVTHTREVFKGFNSLPGQKNADYKVKATLRPYQDEGVKWIKYLYDNRLGGCLADDMGLGKTLQTIAMLSTIYPGCELPTLIVMPRSLLFNWEKEVTRFAPQIRLKTYYGPGRDITASLADTDVVITTYATLRNDIDTLKDIKFGYIVLDESQNIKNVASQTAQAISLLDSDHRLALSGTPMENNLTEIYSLFRFLNPTMFGTLDEFNAAYTNPIQRDGDKDATDSLRRKIFPFLLRRLKKEVLNDLPDRIDQTIYVEMSERQKAFYEERRVAYRTQIKDTIARDGVNKSQFVMFQALSELRRIASVPESLTDGRITSPKIEELAESLQATVANGHKAVVFFNFVAGIELVGQRLEKCGIEYETMTGSTSTPQRKKIVDRFQTDNRCKVLLMTLKVGGVGLNLTAADTVYIFEPWWNKAAEEQAINRLHRIGQKATVNSYSVIAVGSIEEKIVQLQEQKQELFDMLISSDTSSSKHLTEEDIDFILS